MKGMRQKRKQALEATAYHEAGHAVAQLFLGLGLKRVTIVPDKEGGMLGHTRAWLNPTLQHRHPPSLAGAPP